MVITLFKSANKQLPCVVHLFIDSVVGASLGNLSSGRVGIASMATSNLVKAITIGIRYSAVRRQFGPEADSSADEELPVVEYQLQVNQHFDNLFITQ